jgi:hypothetical protein
MIRTDDEQNAKHRLASTARGALRREPDRVN